MSYSTNEAAKVLGVSRITIFNWIQNGRLPAERVGRSYRVPEEAIDTARGIRSLSDYDQEAMRRFAHKVLQEYTPLLERLSTYV